jgi:hypothetical protein
MHSCERKKKKKKDKKKKKKKKKKKRVACIKRIAAAAEATRQADAERIIGRALMFSGKKKKVP